MEHDKNFDENTSDPKQGQEEKKGKQQPKTPLFEALTEDNEKEASMLLKSPDNLNEEDKSLSLSYACAEGHKKLAQTLLESGADINNILLKGFTPLMIAIKAHHRSIAEMLIKYGANLSISSAEGFTAFFYAIDEEMTSLAKGMLNMAKELDTEAGAKALAGQTDIRLALVISMKQNNKELFTNLLPFMPDFDLEHEGVTMLMLAIKASEDHLPEKEAKDSRKSKKGKQPAKNSSKKEEEEEIPADAKDLFFLEQMLKCGADINKETLLGTALAFAVRRSNRPAAEMLIKYGAEIKQKQEKQTVLHIAADNGDCGLVELFIKKGINVNIKDSNDETPLMLAARGGHLKATEMLLGKGSKINIVNRQGMTPLMIALENKNTQIAKLLLQKGAHVYPAN
ncbi:MAG: ankyrin repeat domain-containing protein, partial [Elusimicrobiales bacterium]|nr:ankyrin repeat domain-containing protein [Elusimicrobiales bacterium]